MSTGRALIVGMDGSPRGDAALRWALEIGAHAGDTVRAILVRPRDTLLPGTSFAIQPHGRGPEAASRLAPA
ncbi:universal stress protein [Amycolatopsis sp. NPDC005003]